MGDKKEYIERGAVLRLFDERYITAIVQQKHDDVPEDHKKHWKGVQSGTNWCKNTVLEAPAADVVEVRHGEWIIKTDEYGNEYMMCSYCEDEFYPADEDTVDSTPNYCPSCGAKMDGKRKEQT